MNLDPDTVTPVSPARRRGAFRAALMALFVASLSLTIVFATPTTSEALVPVVPVVTAIGETLAGAGGEVAATSCLATLVCGVAAGVLLVGGLAYMTKDSWLPAFKDALGSNSASHRDTACNAQMNSTMTSNNHDVFAQVSWNCAAGATSTWQAQVAIDHVSCKNSTSGALTLGTGTNGWVMSVNKGPFNGNHSTTKTAACPIGTEIVGAKTSGCYAYFGGCPDIAVKWLGIPTDTDLLSQTSTMTCEAPDGSEFGIQMQATGAAVKDLYGIPSCSGNTVGSIPKHLDVSSGWPGAEQEVGSYDWPSNVKTQYPGCFDAAGGFKATCKIQIWVGGQPCTNGAPHCYDAEQYRDDHPDQVDCKLGTYVVPWVNCGPLKHHYGTTTGTQTVPVIKTTAGGAPVTDPEVDPAPPVDPGPGQPTIPGSGINPTTPTPTPTDQTDPDSQNCYGAAWSWNPVDWIYVPVKCVMTWAFVPRVSLSTRVQAVRDSFDGKFPFNVGTLTGSLAVALPVGGGSDCPDWVVHVDNHDTNVVCASSYTAAIRGVRPFLLAGMLAVAFWPLVRGLFFASVPILKPVPSEGRS